MARHEAFIPTPKKFAIEARLQRRKFLETARAEKPRSEWRRIDLDLAKMYKRHEKAWEETYRTDFA